MNINTRRIKFALGDKQYQNYLAYDDSVASARPAVLVVHEWWGLNDYIVKRVHMLAEMGYVALALDMYGDGQVAQSPDQAGKLMNSVLDDMQTGTEVLKAGYRLLLDQTGVDSSRTAAIGYCFGGGMVLHMARIGLPLSAVASFHGSLGASQIAEPGGIAAKLLVCHGEADSMVTMDAVDEFKSEMDAAEADYEVLLLPDAKHGFSNPQSDDNAKTYDIDLGYQKLADDNAWKAMHDLFKKVF
jgi:dienelactone hydrolase